MPTAADEKHGGRPEEQLRFRRKQRKRKGEKRRRPASNNNHELPPLISSALCQIIDMKNTNVFSSGGNSSDQDDSEDWSFESEINDPMNLVYVAVDHDEYQKDALEVLQVPLETGKLYHNEELFKKAVEHLCKESTYFRWGWAKAFVPSSQDSSDEGSAAANAAANDNNEETAKTETVANSREKDGREKEEQDDPKESKKTQQKETPKHVPLTPVILSGLLATLDDKTLSKRNHRNNKNSSSSANNNSNQDSEPPVTSAELVNYTVRMRRAALSRVRLRTKREQVHRIVKPILAISTVVCLYFYAWSSLQRSLVGFYGVAKITSDPPKNDGGNPADELPRLISSSCRTGSDAERHGNPNDYAKACRMTEAATFELLTSIHNNHHTKLFARLFSERPGFDKALIEAKQRKDDDESHTELSFILIQHEDDAADDTEMPLYAMHTILGDDETSVIPLEDVLRGRRYNRRGEREKKQRWRRKKRSIQNYKAQSQNCDGCTADGGNGGDAIDAAYVNLSRLVQSWGDTTVNDLVREAIVEAHYKSSSTKSIDKTNGRLRVLDAGSGLSGTLFALCAHDFPFLDWSYHGIAISQPEVRRASQLVESVVAPLMPRGSENGSGRADTHDGGSSGFGKFPLTNVTIQQASFDDPLPPKEYTTVIAIESLAFSYNITKTLTNLVRSLEPKGTLIVVDDVVSPWSVTGDGNAFSNYSNYVQNMVETSGKPSLFTHEQWLDHFAKAGLVLHQKPRDLMLEFDAWSNEVKSSAITTAVTGLPFIGMFLGERSWYATGHFILECLVKFFGSRSNNDGRGTSDDDDDGDLSLRALHLMGDMVVNDNGNVHRKAAHRNADLGYYMYVCTKL